MDRYDEFANRPPPKREKIPRSQKLNTVVNQLTDLLSTGGEYLSGDELVFSEATTDGQSIYLRFDKHDIQFPSEWVRLKVSFPNRTFLRREGLVD